jgi:hypothetical protein
MIIVIIATSGGVCSGRFRRLCLQAFPERNRELWWQASHSSDWTVRIFQESLRIAPLMSRISACFTRERKQRPLIYTYVCCRTYRIVKAWSHRHLNMLVTEA